MGLTRMGTSSAGSDSTHLRTFVRNTPGVTGACLLAETDRHKSLLIAGSLPYGTEELLTVNRPLAHPLS